MTTPLPTPKAARRLTWAERPQHWMAQEFHDAWMKDQLDALAEATPSHMLTAPYGLRLEVFDPFARVDERRAG